MVFSFDEKTQCQDVDRTQPSLPMTRGRGETMTHDGKRNGTTDLFAALNVGTGEALTATRRSHKATAVLAFFRWIDLHVERDLRPTSCWTTCQPTRRRRSRRGSRTRSGPAGICTSPRPLRRG